MRIAPPGATVNSLRLTDEPSPAVPADRREFTEDYVTFGQMAGLIRRRWALVLVTTLACAGLALLYAAKATPVYESSALILIDKDQYNLPEMVTHHATEESDLSTEIEMLRSMRLSEDVAHDLALNVSVTGMPRSAVLAAVASLDSVHHDRIALDRVGDEPPGAGVSRVGVNGRGLMHSPLLVVPSGLEQLHEVA